MKFVIYTPKNILLEKVIQVIEKEVIYASYQATIKGVNFTILSNIRLGIIRTESGFVRLNLGGRYDRTSLSNFNTVKIQVMDALTRNRIPYMERNEFSEVRRREVV
ncbi:hypothetical protein BEP19_09490 [Ammoniphilus oxalaticus]|uniref:Uncharacterized protein n=1 Tax=Ammoniphilus oxalaticus TaxID=66863 RepID=A0A419SKX2_9BACL|nr:hypothetical protein [Ammoniphilus oxalaticus]RKD24600.1 hypothetical protein BEP19_09490 [Ammoniphilus oxalaticus]